MNSRNSVPKTFSDNFQPNLIALQSATWEDRERKNPEKVKSEFWARDLIWKKRREDDKRESDDTGHTTGCIGSRLEKKQTINSWKRHALCDWVLSYQGNRWEFEYVIRNSMGNEIWSIYSDKYFEIWTFYA